MIIKKQLRTKLKNALIGGFFVILGLFGLLATPVTGTVYADEIENADSSVVEDTGEGATEENSEDRRNVNRDGCKDSLAPIGWLVCPTTGAISKAVDWLYEKIEGILTINPIAAEDKSPIYEVWKYLKGITNIVFIIFLLVVIYSQITGLGINNYGIKKALPKLIIAAVLVNLSFLICQIAVDMSNIIGDGLRGVFTSIAEAAIPASSGGMSNMAMAEMYSSIAGGAAFGIGAATVAFELGAIWMLIPTVLGALVAVISGLITIALRQAVVALLVMIAPLAMVAYMLPNTEKWFKMWKDLLYRMLVFYPMFSLLFGASQLAGFAIITGALEKGDGFGVLLGTAVQVFPLFFSWKLMSMSGTFLSGIHAKINALAARPLAANRGWAESRSALSRARHLERNRMPSAWVMNYMNNRKVAREAEISEKAERAKERGLAYRARLRYRGGNLDGVLSKQGKADYEAQAKSLENQYVILRDKDNFNKGFSHRVKKGTAEWARLNELDVLNMNASDRLKIEQARGEKINYENAVSFYERMDKAVNAHMDLENGFNEDGTIKKKYKFHFDPNNIKNTAEMARYNAAKQIMEGNASDVQFAAASAAQEYDTQKKIIEAKMQKHFELTPATQDVVYRLNEWTNHADATKNIDSIVAGLRILNQRGDTDKVKQQLDNILEKNSGLMLGTHASQAIASFLMFEVKDSDPFLRRYGKYLNLETARVFDDSDDMRKEMRVTYDEYIKGYHEEPDGTKMVAKKSMAKLVEGTSLDNIERTAMSNLDDSLKKAYGYRGKDDDGNLIEWDVDGYLEKREELQTAFEPAFLSSSLKWLSGSEQMTSAVKFWTGYDLKQKKENGKAILQEDPETGELKPVYELAPVWEGKEFEGHEEQVKEYYKRKTRDYFKDQTTGQILGMRTDYRESTVEHLLDMYLNGVDRGELEESVSASRNAEYQDAVAEIQTRYADEPAHKAQKKREADIAKLKRELAGHQLRDILDKTGKLEQIYNTRRSGAANNAKDWLRQMLNLDDKDEIYRYLDSKNSKRSKETSANSSSATGENNNPTNVSYGDTGFRTRVMAELWDVFDKTGDHGDADMDFYEESLDKITHEFGENSVVVAQYKEYKKYNSNASRGELWDELEKIMSNFFSEYDETT